MNRETYAAAIGDKMMSSTAHDDESTIHVDDVTMSQIITMPDLSMPVLAIMPRCPDTCPSTVHEIVL